MLFPCGVRCTEVLRFKLANRTDPLPKLCKHPSPRPTHSHTYPHDNTFAAGTSSAQGVYEEESTPTELSSGFKLTGHTAHIKLEASGNIHTCVRSGCIMHKSFAPAASAVRTFHFSKPLLHQSQKRKGGATHSHI